jgi:hypothetical protein
MDLKFNPILRVKYDTWGSMEECNIYLKLPQPLRRPFGSEELSAKTLGARWKMVAEAQCDLLKELTEIRRPVELVRFLSQRFSQSWKELERRYDNIHLRSEELHAEVDGLRAQKREALQAWRAAKAERAALERAMGSIGGQQFSKSRRPSRTTPNGRNSRRQFPTLNKQHEKPSPVGPPFRPNRMPWSSPMRFWPSIALGANWNLRLKSSASASSAKR